MVIFFHRVGSRWERVDKLYGQLGTSSLVGKSRGFCEIMLFYIYNTKTPSIC